MVERSRKQIGVVKGIFQNCTVVSFLLLLLFALSDVWAAGIQRKSCEVISTIEGKALQGDDHLTPRGEERADSLAGHYPPPIRASLDGLSMAENLERRHYLLFQSFSDWYRPKSNAPLQRLHFVVHWLAGMTGGRFSWLTVIKMCPPKQ